MKAAQAAEHTTIITQYRQAAAGSFGCLLRPSEAVRVGGPTHGRVSAAATAAAAVVVAAAAPAWGQLGAGHITPDGPIRVIRDPSHQRAFGPSKDRASPDSRHPSRTCGCGYGSEPDRPFGIGVRSDSSESEGDVIPDPSKEGARHPIRVRRARGIKGVVPDPSRKGRGIRSELNI